MSLLSASVLTLALMAVPQAQAPDQRAEAERLARTGAHARALQQFQALAAANPDDVEARLWIARLHVWMGHPERAIDVYQSVVATAPQNVEALVGLGSALTEVGRLADAADALNRAEAIAADQPAVLAAQGRMHRVAGRSTLALAYYLRALALDPGNRDTRDAYDALRALRAHRVEGTYYFERFNVEVADTHAGMIEVNARVNDAVRLFVDGQHWRKLSRDEDRFGAGVEWLAHRNVWLRVGAMFGSDTIVLPDGDASLDAEYHRGRFVWLGSGRYLHFTTTSSVVLSPGATYAPNDWLAVTLRYYRSQTAFQDAQDSAGNNGYSARAIACAGRRLWVNAGYTRGYEGLSVVTFERLTQLSADTATGGLRFDPAPMTSIAATYEHQWRDSATRVGTLFLTVVQRF